MLQIQRKIDAAIATDESLKIRTIPLPGLNLGSFALIVDSLPLNF